MADYSQELLDRGIAAAKDGNKGGAHFLLRWALDSDATPPQRTIAWLWLSEVSDDADEKHKYLEKVLSQVPDHPIAREKLALLEGRPSSQSDVPSSDLSTSPHCQDSQTTRVRRFTCPRCGGYVAFSSDGKELECAYCGYSQTPKPSHDREEWIPETFFGSHALQTIKSYTTPILMPSFTCPACGASFVLAPETLAFSCAYCNAVYAVERVEQQELYPPDGIIPFSISQIKAERAIQAQIKTTELAPNIQVHTLKGVYVPVWSFDAEMIVGSLYQKEGRYSIEYQPFYYNDVPVLASRHISGQLVDELRNYDLKQLVPYNSSYLANWSAEIYQVAMMDASAEAQRRIARQTQAQVTQARKRGNVLFVQRQDPCIESFKLVLVPAWVTHYTTRGKQYQVVINGQSGNVRFEKPVKSAPKWLARLWAYLGEALTL